MNETVALKPNLFSGLITSKTRIQVLMRLFLNPQRTAYLRELASECDASPSQMRDELQQLNDAGLLVNKRQGRSLFYSANTDHALFPELNSMVRKALGMDRIIESIIERLGDVERAILIDDYAEGKDTGLIDLVLVGDINKTNLEDLVTKTERHIGRKIRVLIFGSQEYGTLEQVLGDRRQLVLWECNAKTN